MFCNKKMNLKIFLITLISLLFSIFSLNYQHTYSQYVIDNQFEHSDTIIYLGIFIQLLSWGGVALLHRNNMGILLGCAILGMTNSYLMYQDYLFSIRERTKPVRIYLSRPNIPMLLSLFGWIILGYSVSDDERETRINVIISLLLFLTLTYGNRLERRNVITDGPSYPLGVVALVFFSFYISDMNKN